MTSYNIFTRRALEYYSGFFFSAQDYYEEEYYENIWKSIENSTALTYVGGRYRYHYNNMI